MVSPAGHNSSASWVCVSQAAVPTHPKKRLLISTTRPFLEYLVSTLKIQLLQLDQFLLVAYIASIKLTLHKFLSKNVSCWNSLVVQWLGFQVSIAGGIDLVPDRGTKILHAMQCTQIKICFLFSSLQASFKKILSPDKSVLKILVTNRSANHTFLEYNLANMLGI